MRLTAAFVVAIAVALTVSGSRQAAQTGSNGLSFAALPAAPAAALQVGRPKRLSSGRYLSRWTTVRRPADAHTKPSVDSPVVTRLAVRTPEGTPNLVGVLAARGGNDGTVWVRARLPVLPNGTVGWLPRRDLGAYHNVNTRLLVDRARLTVTLYRAGKPIFRAPVGVGAPGTPTPAGEFTVRSELTRYASRFYGPLAFGTTARSPVLTDWPDGGFVGIHGTNEPALLPGRVSHGCIRLRNRNLLRLAALMPVGTPVTIR